MELTPSLIYWLSRLEELQILCTIFGFFAMLGAVVLGIFVVASGAAGEEGKAIHKATRPAFRWTLPVGAALCLISCFLPDTKTVAAMYVLPKIANNESLDEISSSMKTLAVEWMDELRPKNVRSKDSK